MRVFEFRDRIAEVSFDGVRLVRRPCWEVWVEVEEDETDISKVFYYIDKALKSGIQVFMVQMPHEVVKVRVTDETVDTRRTYAVMFRACFDKIRVLEGIVKELLLVVIEGESSVHQEKV